MPNEELEKTNLSHEEIVQSGINSVKERLEKLTNQRGAMATFSHTDFLPEALIPEGFDEIINDQDVIKIAERALQFQFKIRNFNAAFEIQRTFNLDTRRMVLEDESIRGALVEHIGGLFSHDVLRAADFASAFSIGSTFIRGEMKEKLLIGLLNLFKWDKAEKPANLIYFQSVFQIPDDQFAETGKQAADILRDQLMDDRGATKIEEFLGLNSH